MLLGIWIIFKLPNSMQNNTSPPPPTPPFSTSTKWSRNLNTGVCVCVCVCVPVAHIRSGYWGYTLGFFSLNFFFAQFSRHRVGVPIIHHKPEAKKKKKKVHNVREHVKRVLIFIKPPKSVGGGGNQKPNHTHDIWYYARGGTRGVRHTGMCRSNRSLFWEKSLNIGYGFELENP